VKIGYTSADLGEYLRRLERQYDPLLLATIPGGRNEEKVQHARWRHWLAEGREWFFPTPAMFEAFRRDWRIADDFARYEAMALQDEPW
jgi:hypothetical protein